MENIKIILKPSPYYPQELLRLKFPPEFLFAMGNLELLNTFSIGIVGARACSEESIALTKQLVNELTNRNVTIISGMADGIDHIAHETCIEEQGKTIAVIGSGFYIAKKKKIFHNILKNNGLIISEYFPDIPAFPYNFPRRNQLLVALSKSIVAIETHLKSGTMITAEEALKQNVPLFTFPGGVYDNKYLGNNLLLTQGAICINSYLDMLKQLKKVYPNIDFSPQLKKIAMFKIPTDFQAIYTILDKSPKDLNTIARKTKLSLPELQSKLTLMELDDLVCKLKNNYYIRK